MVFSLHTLVKHIIAWVDSRITYYLEFKKLPPIKNWIINISNFIQDRSEVEVGENASYQLLQCNFAKRKGLPAKLTDF